uniref:MYB transcription factor n=1 Tax=Palpitomonas bilix TaxID=652834 RepID=A0A7S3CVK0_9EUKA|mmetsp:Transcript_11073/g.29066  ORF Transcript_11073/g.29066 Transcript_11073/m.29066 type:complete len:252 (+) Transcript_11073:372-1127(+)
MFDGRVVCVCVYGGGGKNAVATLILGIVAGQDVRRHALVYYHSMVMKEKQRASPHSAKARMGAFQSEIDCPYRWTRKERLMIEKELANYGAKNSERFSLVGQKVNKPAEEIREYHTRLSDDIKLIDSGAVSLPRYDLFDQKKYSSSQFVTSPSVTNIIAPPPPLEQQEGGGAGEMESRKGMAWTEEEHTQFLLGLQECGKGEWRAIAKSFVKTRTGTQVASHAQKFFLRLRSHPKDKKAPAASSAVLPQKA